MMDQCTKKDLIANGAKSLSIGQFIKYVFFIPGFKLVFYYRWYYKWYKKTGIKRLFSWMLWRWISQKVACDISREAEIGSGLTIPHATGIVIGAGVKIASDVTIYQNVTLGRLISNGTRSSKGNQGYPDIKEGAIIYAGACVIGGVTVGKNAVVGANAVVLQDVPDGTTAVGVPARIIGHSDGD